MNKNLFAAVALAICPLLVAQQPLPVPASAQELQAPSATAHIYSALHSAPSQPLLPDALLDGTPVKLRICQTISSEEAKTGQEVPFEVIESVNVSGVPVIKKGDSAFGTVTYASPKKMMGRAGKLNISITYVRLGDQEKVPLRATKESKGRGSGVGMTVGIAASAVLFFPAAPLFLLMHGKDVTIPQGTEITAYVHGDTHIDMGRFGAAETTVGSIQTPVPTAATEQTTLAIDSNPPGADIEIGGAFVGSTPSTVSLPPGSYQILVKKRGFATWARTLEVKGGAIHLNADLDQVLASR